jgi:RpiB/LacA/LacB family sugar-phosphate isomerase
MIALACDHSGIEMKMEIQKMLDEMGLEWKDFGTNEAVSCDYPIYGYRAAKAVADGECDRGILISVHINYSAEAADTTSIFVQATFSQSIHGMARRPREHL